MEGRRQLKNILTSLRRGIGSQKSVFTRSKTFSGALHQYEAESMFGLKNRPKIENLTRNQMIMEIVKAQKFFQSKTSTVAGARQVNREQDIRLFGKNEQGLPNRVMTETERRRFWEVYEEYVHLHPDMYYRLGSSQLQSTLVNHILSSNEIGQKNFNLGDALAEAHEFLEEWELEHL